MFCVFGIEMIEMFNFGCSPNMTHMAVCQNLVPLVNIKIAGKWMLIPLKMILIGIDPYPYIHITMGTNPSPNAAPKIGPASSSGAGDRRVPRPNQESLPAVGSP